MIFRRTKAIVLKRTDYSNTSKIVTLYTRDHGKVRAVAKGARRKKSEFLGVLEPLSLLEVVFIEGKGGLHLLKEAHLIDSHVGLRRQLPRIALGLSFLSLIDQTQPDEDADRAVFDLLASSLSALQRASAPENLTTAFQLRLLRHFGGLPSLTHCGHCRSSLRRSACYYPPSGAFLCEACRKQGKWTLPQGTLQALRRLAETPLERCERIRLSKDQRAEICAVVGSMLRAAIEADLPAEAVVHSLLQ